VIVLDALSVSFHGRRAVAGVSLSIPSRDIVLLAGASGCGKSTLLRAMTGIIPHASTADVQGEVWVAGRRTVDLALADVAQFAGLVFQNPGAQLFNQVVADEVACGPANLGLPAAEVGRRTAWALDVTGMADKASRDIRTLSGGERQRVAIAAVLAMRPSVLVLDEPMASLDVDGTRRLVDVLGALNRDHHTTVIIAEHRLREAAQAARRTILLDEGHVVADGPTTAVLAEPGLLRRLGLRRPGLAPQSDWESLITQGEAAAGSSVVKLDDVDVRLGGQPVLQGVTLDIREGECVALVGDNGSGKSTLARLLAGMVRPSRGTLRWAAGAADPGTGVGILLQDPRDQLFCESVEEEIAFGPRNASRNPAAATLDGLELADLSGVRDRPLHTLSHGQLHRTAFAAVFALRPRLLVLDEPTVGQDWRHLERLMDAVHGLRLAGSAVVLISHDFKLIHRHATRIVLLKHGFVAADGVPRPASAGGDRA